MYVLGGNVMITGSYLILKIEKNKAYLENQRKDKIHEIHTRYLPEGCRVGDYLDLYDNIKMVINVRKRAVREDFLSLLGENND